MTTTERKKRTPSAVLVEQRNQRFYEDGSEVPDDCIYVFLSNSTGHHGKGSAHIAMHKYGAQYTKAIGLSNRSYALNFLDATDFILPIGDIVYSIRLFAAFTRDNKFHRFHVVDFENLFTPEDFKIVVSYFTNCCNCNFPQSFKGKLNGAIALDFKDKILVNKRIREQNSQNE